MRRSTSTLSVGRLYRCISYNRCVFLYIYVPINIYPNMFLQIILLLVSNYSRCFNNHFLCFFPFIMFKKTRLNLLQNYCTACFLVSFKFSSQKKTVVYADIKNNNVDYYTHYGPAGYRKELLFFLGQLLIGRVPS